ncbi:MAG: hypothetical protein JXA69_00925 [Phycisphaerae bacterium]|nr:hypothetical protein [Phycisphaerae bacterium]
MDWPNIQRCGPAAGEDEALIAHGVDLAIEAYRCEVISRGRVVELAERLALAPR